MDKNSQRYNVLKTVMTKNKSSRLALNHIMSVYLSQINKASNATELDEVLDAIIYNESLLKKQGKGNL